MQPESNKKIAAAFFDVDGTVLAKNSGPLYLKFMLDEGKISVTDLMRGMWWFAQYKFGKLDWEKVSLKMAADIEGDDESEMIRDCRRWFDTRVKRHIRPEMIEAMNKHCGENRPIVLLTAASIYLTRPLGEHLGIDRYICNYLGVENGKFTGKLIEPACYGKGKVLLAEKYAAENNIDLSQSYFYTDSITDLPVCERIGYPVIVNPDPILRREAKRRGWPVYDYKPPQNRR